MLRRPLALLIVAVLVLGGCASTLLEEIAPSAVPTQVPVHVEGSAGEAPVLEYPQPYEVYYPGSRTLWPGSGEVLEPGEPVLLHMYAEDGTDGSAIISTYTDAPAFYTFSPADLGENLFESLRGKRVGARVLLVEQDDGVPVVLVVDVLPTRADGTPIEPDESVPQVLRDPDGAPSVQIPDADPPDELVVQPLIRGSGNQVRVGHLLTTRYVAVRWSDGSLVDSSWTAGVPPQSATIGIGRLVEGWDQGLLEQAVGSQVMLVVPPRLGYGGTSSDLSDETLVYVVDILESRFQTTDELPLPGDEQEVDPDAVTDEDSEG